MRNRLVFPALQTMIAVGLISGCASRVAAEPRTFKNSDGREIVAEPISNTGDGTVQLKRGDGKLFQVKIADMSPDDQTFLREWARANPPKIDYRFEIKAVDEKLSGNGSTQLGGYKKVKNELWTYRVQITNLSRQTVSGLKIEYRVFVRNEADGQFRDSSGAGEGFRSGTANVDKELRFNESTSITTGEVKIDSVTYDWSYSRDERYKDALRGIMIRIKDPKGNVVQEFVSANNSMKGKTWDTVPAALEIKSAD